MASILLDTIGGFNAYVESMKRESVPIEFTLVQFSSIGFQKSCVAQPIGSVPELNVDNYRPEGGTPLIEASYKTIQAVAESLAKRQDKPKVIVCIQTDGEENASDQRVMSENKDESGRPIPLYSWRSLKKLVESKIAEGWQFNFLGTGIDAYAQASSMGIPTGATIAASMDAASTRASYNAMGASSMRYARGLASDTSFLSSETVAAGDLYRDKYTNQAPQGAVPGAPTVRSPSFPPGLSGLNQLSLTPIAKAPASGMGDVSL